MKHAQTIIIAMLAALFFAACGHHRYPQALLRADSMVAKRPDSAKLLLGKMAKDTASWAEDARMFYRLLCLETADRLYLTPSSDSAVRPLLSHYEHDGDHRLLPRAYYAAGRVYSEMNDAPQAINCYLEAIAAADTLRDRLLLCKAYTQMGYLYSDMRLNRRTLEAFRQSYQLRKDFASPRRMTYVLRDIARAYADLNLPDSALIYYAKGLKIARQNGIHEMEASIHTQMAGLFVNQGKYELAWKHLRPALEYGDTLEHEAVYSIAGHLYNETGQPDSAAHYYKLLAKEHSLATRRAAYRNLIEYYMDKGEVPKALKMFEQGEQIADSLYEYNAAEAVAHIGALYDYSLREKENERLKAENDRTTRRLIGISLLGLLAIAALAYVLTKALTKNRKLTKEIKIYEAQREKQEVKPAHQMVVESEIYKRINALLKTRKNMKGDDWLQLDTIINEQYPGFREKLHTLCNMSESDYHICLLLKAKLRLKDIAQLTNLALSSLSSARSRLYFRSYGKKGSATDWDSVIDNI